MTGPPPERPGASRGVLKNVVPDRSVSDDESLAGFVGNLDRGRPRGEFPVSEPENLLPKPPHPVPAEAMRPRYTRAALLAQCDPNAPMPDDLADWERAAPVGREFGAVRTVPVSRGRRELTSIIRRGETVVLTRRGVPVAKIVPIE